MNIDMLFETAKAPVLYISKKIADMLYDHLLSLRERRKAEILLIADTFGEPLELARVYIEPNCQNVNPANTNEDEPDGIVTTPIFQKLNNFFNGEFKGEPDGRNQLFILSDAGMGKTSLLMMIKLSHIVGHEQPGLWPNSRSCVLLKIGQTTLNDIEAIKDKANTILLLDALDEDPDAWNDFTRRIKQLLHASRNCYRVIISCRTQFFPDQQSHMVGDSEKVEVKGFKCPLIYLSLFNKEQVIAYLKRLYPDYSTNNLSLQKVKRALEIILKIGSLSLRPMLLAHIDDLARHEQSIWNEYTTFRALIGSWLLREERKPNSHVNKQLLLQGCTILASAMQAMGQRSLGVEYFEHYFKMYPELQQLGNVDIGGRSLLNRNSKGEYRFCHYTIQEFLIADSIINPDKKFSTFELKLTDRVIAFLSAYVISKQKEASSEAPLGGIFLDGLDIAGHNLENARLHGASFVGTNLSRARLKNATLTGANFCDADLSDADVVGADFEQARLLRTRIRNTHLENANCSNAILEEIDIKDMNFERMSYRGIEFTNILFSGESLVLRNQLRLTHFLNCNFKNCSFFDIVFSGCHFEHCGFSGCMFRNIVFKENTYKSVKFDGENLKGVIFANEKLQGVSFVRVTLSGNDMRGCDLTDANLRGADLQFCMLEGAIMTKANLSRANLQGANVSGVDAFKGRESSAFFEDTILPDGKMRSGRVVAQ